MCVCLWVHWVKWNCREGRGRTVKPFITGKVFHWFWLSSRHQHDRGETGRVNTGWKHECQSKLTPATATVKQQHTLFLATYSWSPASQLECTAGALVFTEHAQTGSAGKWRESWTGYRQRLILFNMQKKKLALKLVFGFLNSGFAVYFSKHKLLTERCHRCHVWLSRTLSYNTVNWHSSWLSGWIRLSNFVSLVMSLEQECCLLIFCFLVCEI